MSTGRKTFNANETLCRRHYGCCHALISLPRRAALVSQSYAMRFSFLFSLRCSSISSTAADICWSVGRLARIRHWDWDWVKLRGNLDMGETSRKFGYGMADTARGSEVLIVSHRCSGISSPLSQDLRPGCSTGRKRCWAGK